jgi:hypothetical protein
MTTTQLTGKILMTLATGMYGFIPPVIDFSRTHATNPLWVSHARFHVVWQVIITFFLAIVGIYLLWFCKADPQFSINLSFILGLIVLGGFLLNVAVRKVYAGTLSDPNGVPPIFKNVDANLFCFSLAFLLLVSGYVIFQ